MGRNELSRRDLTLRVVVGTVAGLVVAALLAAVSGVWSLAFPSDEPTSADQIAEVQALGERMDGRFDEMEEVITGLLEGGEDTGGRVQNGDADDSGGAVAIDVFSRHLGGDSDDWDTAIDVVPGDQVEHLVRFENTGETRLENVMVGANLPNYTATRPETTWLLNSNSPDGRQLENDNVTAGGINVGHYGPGATGFVWFTVEVDPVGAFDYCGSYTLRTVGIVRPEGMNPHLNSTDMDVIVDCS